MTFLDSVEAGRILKVVYGCVVWPMLPYTRARVLSATKQARHECGKKLLDARRRRDAWEMGVHRDHLVGFDAELLRRAA